MKKILIIIFVILMLALFVRAGDNFSFSGYYKSFFIGFQLPDYTGAGITIPDSPPIGAVNNRLRLKFSAAPSNRFSINVAYDFSPRIQDPLLFGESIFFDNTQSFSYRFDDFSPRSYPRSNQPVGSFAIFHNLDRFFITLKTRIADIFIGRQAIAWGSAYVINPTDTIAPFTFNELDTEERRGVDAVRVRIPLGMMDEIDIGYIFGQDFKFADSAVYLRGKVYLMKMDIALLLMGFRENLLLGFDLSRSIGGAGSRFETAYVKPGYFNKEEKGKEEDYVRASVGLDYNFSGKIYSFIEYHFNSAGKSQPEDYGDFFRSTAFLEGTAYLMGRHYLNVGLTYQVSPLIPFTGMVIYNLSDGSFSMSPSLEYNIAENIYLSAGAYLGLGKRPEIVPITIDPVGTILHSEFGAYPHMFFAAFRIYF
ncbi:MAG: hypothetical protein KAT34_16440 [Candidatus Aminicenantes bacterium]|nr:hypothetical protein [Candidatus Aminicenantes bacterium]